MLRKCGVTRSRGVWRSPIRGTTAGMHSWSLQIASDLHLEHGGRPSERIRPSAPVLALLGDVGSPGYSPECAEEYGDFLMQQSANFDKVFVLAGNHEYYSSAGHAKELIDREIENFCVSILAVRFV